jgi:hypothetical protein
MTTITVNVQDLVRGTLKKYSAVLNDPALLHDAIRVEAEATVKRHLEALKGRSPNTGYYAKAAAGVNSRADATAATVIIQAAGIGLRHFGGEVKPGRTISSKTGKPTKAVAVPTKYVPIVNQQRSLPKDMPLLAFVPNRKGGDTTGYLVEGEQRLAKKGKSKGKYITVAKKDGKMMFVLRKRTTHEADPSVLPGDEELQDVAMQAIIDLLETYNDQTT